MIIVERFYSIKNFNGLSSEKSILNMGLEEAVKLIKPRVGSEGNQFAYLKDINNDNLIKIKWSSLVQEVSYILDLFDFKKEFLKSAGVEILV